MIELKNVTIVANQKTILKNINLKFSKDKKYLLLGPSGSGKTTLFYLLNHLKSVSEGEIFLDKRNYLEYEPVKIRKKISLIMQESALFGKTVKDNFEYINSLNNKELHEKDFLEYMKKLNLPTEFFHKEIGNLSGGEKQRISIIRTLMNKPEYILADEPFSALDKSRINELHKLLFKYCDEKNIGLILISHYFEKIIEDFDEVIFISKGEIVFKGETEKFLKSNNKKIVSFLEGSDV